MAEPNVTAVIQAHHRRLLAIRSASGRTMGATWDQLANVDQAAAEQFVEAAASVATASVDATAAIADAMYTVLAPTSAKVAAVVIRGGASPAEVYLRSIVTARTVLSRGGEWKDAMAAGKARAVSTAETDVALANRAAAEVQGQVRPQVQGYRRVLTGASCLFCATASTQRYHSADLLPLHPHCDCDIAAIFGTRDPGHVINKDLLGQLKANGSEYWKQRGFVSADGQPLDPDDLPSSLIAVHEHGEMGAVLGPAGQHFDELAA